MSAIDKSLQQMNEDWEAFARYTVYRNERDKPDVILATGLTLGEARERVQSATAALEREPGYRPHVMSRAIISFRLENQAEAVAGSRARREATGGT